LAVGEVYQTGQARSTWHGLYQGLEKAGKLLPNQKLMNVLSAWKSGGIDAVRVLVKKGLAPAVVLGLLPGVGSLLSPGDSES
jgi:hypothetical protein